MKWYEFSLLGLYIVSILSLVVLAVMKPKARALIIKIHSGKDGEDSWTRWSSTLLVIVVLGMYIYQVTFDKIVDPIVVVGLLTMVFGGKVTESIIKKN